MNAFTIAGIVGIGVILVGILLAVLMVWLSRMVSDNQVALTQKQTAYNPALTMGHQIPVEADLEAQLKAARLGAARRAASLERGANMRIGRLGEPTLQPASKNLDDDPVTAVKIATFHTWQGARVGPPVGGAAVAAAPVAGQQRAAVMKRPEDLKPGVDYPYIEITEGMDPAEVRRARIANAKAQAAAVKALKEAGVPAEAAGVAPQAAAPGAAAPVAAPAVNVPEPELIEITDDMPPDQVRAARIANAKAQAAYQKALKEAQAAAPAAVAQPAAAAAPAAAAPVAAPAVNIPEPELIEITDDMPADQVRAARIANAKAQAAYQKALKEAGAAAPAAQPAAAAPAPAAAPPPAAAPAQAVPSNIARPDLIEITDDMDPGDVRRARIANAKAKAEYQKALREAGIDPATVPLD